MRMTTLPSGKEYVDPVIEQARRAVETAEEAHEAARADPATPKHVVEQTKQVLKEIELVLAISESSPRARKRQNIAEFAELLGEEIKEAAEEVYNEANKYAERTLRQAKSLIEDHFHIDEAFRMLGPLRQDANLARDVHDWFNLVALVPVIALNMVNWQCSSFRNACGVFEGRNIISLWHGQEFGLFWWTTVAYFIIDLLFIVVLPTCVKSPKIIIQHHVLTLGYVMVPWKNPRVSWLMGTCMIVEVNTWFLIARRSFNKNGDKPFSSGVSFFKSIRLVVVSVCFYFSWFAIRLGIYPFLLGPILKEWMILSRDVGSYLNVMTITPVMQCGLIFMNVKWTIDMIRAKLKFRRIKGSQDTKCL